MKLRAFSDRQTLVDELAEHIRAALQKSIAAAGQASLAVSGGSTPLPLFERLSALDIPWHKVFITLADERWVEPSAADSNEGLVRRHLLQNRAAAAFFVSLKNAAATAKEGEAECERGLQKLPLPFTVVILGLGHDGHTASLFPCAVQLGAATDMSSKKRCMAVMPQTAPHERMTLTLPILCKSKEIILHITGPDKKSVLDKALSDGPLEAMPIRCILAQETVPVTAYWAA